MRPTLMTVPAPPVSTVATALIESMVTPAAATTLGTEETSARRISMSVLWRLPVCMVSVTTPWETITVSVLTLSVARTVTARILVFLM